MAYFSPVYDDCQVVTTGSSANVTWTAGPTCLKIVNHSATAAEHVFFKVGTSSQTATNNDCVVAPGETIYVSVSESDDNIATLAGSGTPNVCR
jgi:hypothetical protein